MESKNNYLILPIPKYKENCFMNDFGERYGNNSSYCKIDVVISYLLIIKAKCI